jgi:hypothetical protein
MAKAKRRKSAKFPGPKLAREQAAPPHRAGNRQLTAQNRKLLGKHYANKYRVGS